jgi:hypothetical protein
MAMPWVGPFITFRHADLVGSIPAVMDEDMPVMIQYFKTGITGSIVARKEARRAWRSQYLFKLFVLDRKLCHGMHMQFGSALNRVVVRTMVLACYDFCF